MGLIAMDGLPFHVATSANLKEFCRILNPQFRLPVHDILQNRLHLKVRDKKRQAVNYLLVNIGGGVDHNGPLNMLVQQEKISRRATSHYMKQEYRMSSVAIGMGHLVEPRITVLILTSVIFKCFSHSLVNMRL
jgi:hypothetical protein